MDYRMNRKKISQRLLLLVMAFGMAMVGVMLLSKLREGRVFGLLLRDQDQQILTLQLLLQRERETSKAMKRKLEDLRTKNFMLRTQKTELSNKLMKLQAAAEHLQKMQNEMEASFEEKKNNIKSLTEKAEELNVKVADLSEVLKQKEAEDKEAKKQFEKLSTNSTEGREVNNQDEEKSEQNEETPKDGKWVEFQTNGEGKASDDDQSKKPTFSQGSTQEIKEQNEEHRNNEEQEANRGRAIETSQPSTTEIKEERKEPENDQQILNNMDLKEIVAAQDEQEKPATPKELTIEAEGKEHKVRRNKNRGKGRRRTPRGSEYEKHSIKEDNRYGSIVKKELEGERKETAHETANIEILEGSQVDGSSNGSQGQINSEARTEAREEITSTKEQSEMSENPSHDEAKNGSKEEANANSKSIPKQTDVATAAAEDEDDSKVHEGDNIDKNAEGEEKELTPTKEQSKKFENPREDEAKKETTSSVTRAFPDLNTEKESDTEKQEEEDVNIENNPKYTAVEDGEDSKVHTGKETSTKEQKEKPENPKEDEVKNEKANDKTRASVDLNTEKENDAEKQDGAVKEAADVSTAQISESMANIDDS